MKYCDDSGCLVVVSPFSQYLYSSPYPSRFLRTYRQKTLTSFLELPIEDVGRP